MDDRREGSPSRVDSASAPLGEEGERRLASGASIAMRMWDHEPPTDSKPPRTRDYETVGYVLEGRAELRLGEETVMLQPGDSWVVPRGAEHTYRILEPFTAVEAVTKGGD